MELYLLCYGQLLSYRRKVTGCSDIPHQAKVNLGMCRLHNGNLYTSDSFCRQAIIPAEDDHLAMVTESLKAFSHKTFVCPQSITFNAVDSDHRPLLPFEFTTFALTTKDASV